MAKCLNLDILQALAASGAYGGFRDLSPETAVTILSAGVWLSNLTNWQGVGDELTPLEIDEIEALVAELEFETMTEEGAPVGSYIKIAEAVAVEDIASLTVDDFDSGVFHSYELVIHGMKSNSVATWVDHVKMTMNGGVAATDYDFYGRLFYNAVNIDYENIGTFAGIPLLWAASTSTVSGQSIGDCRVFFPDPQGDDFKRCNYRADVFGFATQRIIYTEGVGVWENESTLSSIKIEPNEGTLFKIDPDSNFFPSELRMTLYGLG